MNIIQKNISSLLLALLLPAAIPLSATASDEFHSLYSQAKDELNTDRGMQYNKKLIDDFFENYSYVFDRCSENNKKSSKEVFSAVYEISDDGIIKEFHLGKRTEFSVCIKSEFDGMKVPLPPFDGYLIPFNWGRMG